MRKRFLLLLFAILSETAFSAVTVYELYPNIHTIGIMVVFDTPVSATITSEVFYEEFQNGAWSDTMQGLELSRVTDLQYSGCIFWTKPNTQYRIRARISDSVSVLLDSTQTITTRSEPESITPLRTFYVSPSGTGISQDINSPGGLNQLLLDSLLAGDKVILLAGTYYTGELEIITSGTEQHPIVFEGDSGVVIDGSFQNPVQWKRVTNDTAHTNYNMFYANLGALNTNCVIVDGKRMYPYRNLLELSLFQTIRSIDGSGFASGNFDIGLSGFFRDGRNPLANHFPYVGFNPNTYIKFADGTDTTGKSIQVSMQPYCFRVSGKSNIQFRNIEFRYFGAAKLENYRCALLLENCDSMLVDSCRFLFCDRGVVFKGNSDDNIVQRSSFFDDMGNWSYMQFKETNEDYGQLNTYYPNFFPYNFRNIEPGRVYFDHGFTGRGNIMRYNVFDGGCDGISCPSTQGDSSTSRNFDIYGNEFKNSSDDAFEVDGDASNMRIWGNVIHNAGGVSAASPCYGPVYVFRNVIYDLPEIHYEYIYFDIGGYHLHSETVSASPLKLNAAYCDIPGVVYFMHNTCDVGATGLGFYLQQPQAQPSWANVIARNNIFYVESDKYALWVRATDKVDLDYNCYYSTQGFTARKDRNGFGLYYSLADASQNILGDVNDSSSFIESHGYELDPSAGWRNEVAHDYRLTPASNMLDKGIYIPGVNDGFSEAAPDLGAFELVVVRDTVFDEELVEVADTVTTRDTIEIIHSGIIDTLTTSASSVVCDSQLVNGTVFVESDSIFNDTLFITATFSQINHLNIHCDETVVDSFFIPEVQTRLPENDARGAVIIFPNPNNGEFAILLDESWNVNETEVLLYDLTGKKHELEKNIPGKTISVRCGKTLASGIYRLQLKTGNTHILKQIAVLGN